MIGFTYELLRIQNRDGEETTVYLVRHPLRTTRRLRPAFRPAGAAGPLVRDERPQGGDRRRFLPARPVPAARGAVARTACASSTSPSPRRGRTSAPACTSTATSNLAPRDALPADPVGDLVQAGPLLVRDGRSVIDGSDPEGFSAGSRAVRLRHHRRPLPARRAGRERGRAAGGVLRRPALRRRRGPGHGGARPAADLVRRPRRDQPRRRRVRRRSCTAATSSTARTRTSTSPRRSRARWSPRSLFTA